MILSEDGKYYFDYEKKIPYDMETHNEVLSEIFPQKGYPQKKEIYKRIEGGVEFEFREYFSSIMVKSLINLKGTALKISPLELSLKKKENEENFISEKIDVFSQEQLTNILKNRNIEYPISNSVIITEEVMVRILKNTSNMKFEILNLPLKEIFNEIKEKQGTFGFLSKYINLYMKSEIDFNDNSEKEFFNKEDFTVKKEDKMDFYYSENDLRAEIIKELKTIIQDDVCYFMTGPHGTGKSFTLLGFLSFEAENHFKYIYINLDILKNSKNKMEILFYEARNLFDNEDDYLSAFNYIKKNLKINFKYFPNKEFFLNLDFAFFPIILCLVDYLDGNKKNQMKYVIVIDQFKYRNDNNYITKFIITLKEKIEKLTQISLIVCSSLNYYGIKENLIMKINRETDIKLDFDYKNKLCAKPNIQNESKYLYLFGYLPRFCQINKMINKKYINFMKKIIKKKFYKFYSTICEKNYSVEDFMIMNLKWIKNNNKLILSDEQFLEFIRKNPIKYFIINLFENTFDFLFPLVEIIIDELIKSKELKDSRFGLYNEAQIGWYFEHSFFDKIKNENFFLNYYIENTIIIKTIFKKEKLENFDKNANTLFCFSISNVKRYDGVIYIADKEYAILTQASIHKSEKKLEQYTVENIKKDIEIMEKRFFRPNGIHPKKYYLIFILDYENYHNSKGNMDTLKKFDYNYCFYNPSKNLIDYKYIKDLKLKEIGLEPYYINEEEEEEKERDGFFFIKNENFKTISEDEVLYQPGYYYVEKGIDLFSFLEETCSEFEELIKYLSQYKSKYSKYNLKSYCKEYSSIVNLNELCSSKIMIALNKKDFFFGESINNNINNFKDKYRWKKFSNEYFENKMTILNKNEENCLYLIKGFFYFESF